MWSIHIDLALEHYHWLRRPSSSFSPEVAKNISLTNSLLHFLCLQNTFGSFVHLIKLTMPYLNFTCRLDERHLIDEEMLRRKSQVDVIPGPSKEAQQISSTVIDSKGESSLGTFRSNYENLAHCLKSCLDYASIVCKRYSVEKEKLVRLLLAEGLIQEQPGEIMEDTGVKIVHELISLGMLRELEDGTEVEVPKSYHELSILKVEKQEFVAKTSISPHRVMIRDDGRDIHPFFEDSLIQSLFIITVERRHSSFYPTRGLSRGYMEAVCSVRSLLVLDLDGKIECLPDEVGNLVHLRYLGLVNSDMDALPPTLANLQRLQTLDIRMSRLEILPVEILSMTQLRHILMSKCINDGEIRVPKGIRALSNLHTLCGLYAGDGIASELSALTQLRELGAKRVSEDHASELSEAIMNMENLVCLSLEAEEIFFEKEDTPFSLFPEMEQFCPPPLLQKLYLHGGLVELPSWIVSMGNLTSLYLSSSALSENPTPALQSLPKLRHLTLWNAYKAKQIGKEFCKAGGFPVLETLTIASDFLVEWTEIVQGAFPSLKCLGLRNCLSLKFLPEGLQTISTLDELHLSPMHPDLARRLSGEENYKIKHISQFWTIPWIG
ncbi:hypothetical protein Tsubulata_009986 [Turnera subulata]|uniref:NB-ARC domain-containing protein n=1 Tax=Turnera subulata TaxID=218843 RepID=A0A9Q0G580_9ROSI|nr:hypothetical protein Tsubulata_009986 [Turnera subulata]